MTLRKLLNRLVQKGDVNFDPDRRKLLEGIVATSALMALSPSEAFAVTPKNKYSPRSKNRAIRPHTDYIILHTTEGPDSGLNKIVSQGLAHYTVMKYGRVYRTVERHKIAKHAGRSMWDGRTNIDNWAIGIEIVGYHNKPLTSAQNRSLTQILSELQNIYDIDDENVLTHSMVAYGSPNRWHSKSHRGRKRCAMLLGTDEHRAKIGLNSKPPYDPDVRAGRLIVADSHLNNVLWGSASSTVATKPTSNTIDKNNSAWNIAREQYNSNDTIYTFPDGTKFRGTEISNWSDIPSGTKVSYDSGGHVDTESEGFKELGVDGETLWSIAGSEYDDKTTIYFIPDGRVRRGDHLSKSELDNIQKGTKVLVGYIDGGRITSKRNAFDICGQEWNYPSTLYRLPDGTIKTGDEINANNIPKNTLIYFRD